MTATVGTLLDDVHARAWDLCTRSSETEEGTSHEQAAGYLAAWPRLANAALRVLDAVHVEPVWLDDASAVREVLRAIAVEKSLASPSVAGSDVAPAASERAVLAIATRLGAIADMLSGQPAARTEVDHAASLGMQANAVAVVHAVAVTTLAALGDQHEFESARWLMRGVAARTQRHAATPTVERAGRYEDVAAVSSEDRSLDGAIARWLPATVAALGSPRRVTQNALQFAAGDALILIATAGTVLNAAAQVGLVRDDPADRARPALVGAHEAWRPLVSWPGTVRLHGVRDVEQFEASRQLRQVITDNLRENREWLPPETLSDRFDLASLMGSLRRGMHALGNVSVAHFQALDRLVRSSGQLWIAASAVTQPAYRGAATVEAACRKGWVPMPPGEPAGLDLLADAKKALAGTAVAVAALDATAAAAAAPTQRGSDALKWEGGRIVACGADDHPRLFETVYSPEPAGARSERRAPVRLGGPQQSSPRR
ncbi:hypothetical protein [Propionicicella superfundia]|uniref:hypothetical protein n=1 Tax=Propionicicella superfundia TaxID=348582 RepID=UPI000403D171|nr:hypothetical protein [Propionicicella superfundia]